MVRSSQIWHMDEQVTYRLWRSSMGYSEVVARWPMISMARSVGSAISNMGCYLATMIANIDVA